MIRFSCLAIVAEMNSDSEQSEGDVCADDSSSSSSERSNSSSSDTEQMGRSYRKKRRESRYEHYVSGAGRSVYKLRSQDLENAMELSPTLEGVCSSCASGLAGIARGFFMLKQQGTELKKRKIRMPDPKHPERLHYRNINEWLRGNVFDSMGNYMFCHSCIRKALKVSAQRLSRQRNVKKKALSAASYSDDKERC